MSWPHRLLNMIRPGRHARDLQREVAFHLDERADDLRAAGLSADEATHEARRRFGNRTLQQERMHEADVVAWIESVAADVRYALRDLAKSPGFALVAILSLALGIGANTAIFSLTNAVVLKSLPVSHPDQLVDVYMKSPGDAHPTGNNSFTNPLWEQLRADSSVFASAAAYGNTTFNLSPTGEVRNVNGAWVSGDFFRTLGVRAEAGRLLRTGDDVRGCPGVAAVSDGFAQREFGGAARAVGRPISLNGNPFTISGVVDPSFYGLEVGQHADVYAPLCTEAMFDGPGVLENRSHWYLFVVGRVKPGLTPEQANAELAARAPAIFRATLPAKWAAASQANYLKTSLGATSASTGLSGVRDQYRTALYFLLAAVGVVLLIACANIANLLLARGAARQREISVRLALGAGRARVVRQLFTESLVLALVGAALGALFAHWAARLLAGFIVVRGEPVWLDLGVDPRVLGFTIGVAVVTALLFGLIPAYRATRVDPQAALRAGGRGVIGLDARHRAGRALVVGQVALSLGLVSVAALLIGSFRRLVAQDLGFDRRGVLIANMDFTKLKPDGNGAGPSGGPSALQPYYAAQRQMLDRLREVPGVTGVAAAFSTPMSGWAWNEIIVVPGYTPPKGGEAMSYFNQVTAGYFAAMRTTVLAGRGFTDADGPTSTRVAVVNEAMAHEFFGRANPVGRIFEIKNGDSTGAPIRIVGLVRTAKYATLSEKPRPTIYLPLGQGSEAWASIGYLIRGSGSPQALVPAVKAAAAGISPLVSLQFTTLDDQIAVSLARPRLLATLSGFFGLLALLLAVIGLYGTMSYAVTQRRNEIGIRMALGAPGTRVLGMIVGEAGRLVVLGLLGGVLLSLATTRYVASFLFGVTPTDPATLAAAVWILGAVAIGAAVVPAWRASEVDPMEALREE